MILQIVRDTGGYQIMLLFQKVDNNIRVVDFWNLNNAFLSSFFRKKIYLYHIDVPI